MGMNVYIAEVVPNNESVIQSNMEMHSPQGTQATFKRFTFDQLLLGGFYEQSDDIPAEQPVGIDWSHMINQYQIWWNETNVNQVVVNDMWGNCTYQHYIDAINQMEQMEQKQSKGALYQIFVSYKYLLINYR